MAIALSRGYFCVFPVGKTRYPLKRVICKVETAPSAWPRMETAPLGGRSFNGAPNGTRRAAFGNARRPPRLRRSDRKRPYKEKPSRGRSGSRPSTGRSTLRVRVPARCLGGHEKSHLPVAVASNGAPNGTRTRVTALKGRCPRPLDDGDADVGKNIV